MVLRRTVSIKRLGGDEAGEKAFGRFLRNKRVSEAALITAAKSHLLAQVAGRRVLAIQDTSEINFSRHTRSKTAFGRGGNGTDAAFFVHPVLAVDADSNVILGLADVQLWQRHGTAAKEASRTTDEKESRRWLAGAEAAASLRAAGSTAVTVVADREGDLYPAFARRPGAVNCWSAPRPSAGWPVAAICSHISMVFPSRIASFSICQPSPDVARGAPQWSCVTARSV